MKALYIILFILCCIYQARSQNSHVVDSLKQLIEREKVDTEKVKELCYLSQYLGCHDTAGKFNCLRLASTIAKDAKWDIAAVYINGRLGDIYFDCLKNDSVALEYYKLALLLSKKYKDTLSETRILYYIGSVYLYFGHYKQAIESYNEILSINPDAIDALGNIGEVYVKLGDYPRAIGNYERSLSTLCRPGRKLSLKDTLQQAGLLSTIGDLYLNMLSFSNALKKYAEAIDLLKNGKYTSYDFLALSGIGKTYMQENELRKAIDYYLLALDHAGNLRAKKYQVNILNLISTAFLKMDSISKSLEYAEKALSIAKEREYQGELSLIYITLGRIHTAKKDYIQAVRYFKEGIAICEKSGSITDEKDAWEGLSSAYQQMNKPALAFEAYRHFISIRDSVYNVQKAHEINRIDIQAEYDRKTQLTAVQNKLDVEKQRIYTYTGFTGLALVLLLAFFIYRGYNHEKKANIAISTANVAITEEKQKADALLLNILPGNVAQELKTHGSVQARLFEHVTVMFTDFVNFTEAGERMSPQQLVEELHTCFKAFDQIIGNYNIEKIKTVGDAYVAASGLPDANPNHAADIVKAAIECRDFMLDRKRSLGDQTFAMRIGINSGTVVAGIVGVRKFAYDIWGDTVNTAARMEQYSEPDKINISQATRDLVKNEFTCTDRGEIDAKHKGKMRMYFVET